MVRRHSIGRSKNTELRSPSHIPLETYEDFTRHLADREYFGQKLGLERMQALLDRLGRPERRFDAIHIAGTNGKGSTAAMLASMLASGGYRVGLFTSPHLQDFCERIQVKGCLISRDEVLGIARRIREVEAEPLTFFELATAIAFVHFAESPVDIAVVEVGLGGRLDATNVLTPLVSVITSIGRDHTAILGDTIAKIALEKAGIVKPGVPVVVGVIPLEAMEVIREQAGIRASPVHVAVPEGLLADVRVGLAGGHQCGNAAVAMAVMALLQSSGRILIRPEAIRKGLEDVRWPGRLETIQEKPWILLDGAHNPDAMKAVRRFLEASLQGRRLKVIFGAMADKDLEGVLKEIAPLAAEMLVTAPHLDRAASPESLAPLAGQWCPMVRVCPDIPRALIQATQELDSDEVLLVTGSLFVVGEARTWFGPSST